MTENLVCQKNRWIDVLLHFQSFLGPSTHIINQYNVKGTVPVAKGLEIPSYFTNWGKEFTVQFDLVIKTLNGHFTGAWQNIIHLTIGGNGGVLGQRIPAVWLHKTGTVSEIAKIHI